MKIIDTHCHLHMDYYKKDREEVIKRAYNNNCIFMLTVGISSKDSEKACELAENHQIIYASAGIHPHNAKSASESDFEKIHKLCNRKKVIALGEIGLDFYRNLSPKKSQEQVFEKLLNMAIEIKIPVIIHTREAHRRTKDFIKRFPLKGVIHCFSGSKDDAKDYMDMGFYISFAGNLTYNKDLEEVAQYVPLDRLLVETDAPFLTPSPLRGKRNEPSFVKYTIMKLSSLKDIDPEYLVEKVWENVKTLFSIE